MPSSAINQLFAKVEPAIARAFLNAIGDLNEGVDFARLKKAIRSKNIQEAIQACNLAPAAFNDLQDAITRTYREGGTAAQQGLKGAKTAQGQVAVIRFDVRDTQTEAIIRRHVTNLVGDITDDMRNAIRSVLENGLAVGKNPLSVARDLVGYLNPKTGQRVGGSLGLTNTQVNRAIAAEAELRTNPAKFLKRELRDKRFDRTIRKHIREGTPIPEDKLQKIVTKYRSDLLYSRGETVARTEAMSALHAGQREMYEQAIRDGYVSNDEIEREWSNSGDNRVRESHRDMDGQTVKFDEPFVTPDGANLMYPGDPNGPAEEVINCRCYEIIRVNYLARIGR